MRGLYTKPHFTLKLTPPFPLPCHIFVEAIYLFRHFISLKITQGIRRRATIRKCKNCKYMYMHTYVYIHNIMYVHICMYNGHMHTNIKSTYLCTCVMVTVQFIAVTTVYRVQCVQLEYLHHGWAGQHTVVAQCHQR